MKYLLQVPFPKYADRKRKDWFTVWIQYLLSEQLNASSRLSRLKLLLGFRKSLRLKTKRCSQLLDFAGETEGEGMTLREADVWPVVDLVP
jgi:hypothetical protein